MMCVTGSGLSVARAGAWMPVVLVAAALVTSAGCGGAAGTIPRGAVEGTVTLDAVPLPDGVIRFTPTAGTTGPMVEAPITNGVFSLPKASGPCVGTQRVEILSFRTTGKKLVNEGIESDEIVQVVPDRYNSASELTVTIASGANALEPFALVGTPRK
jgi:hypothetical protein